MTINLTKKIEKHELIDGSLLPALEGCEKEKPDCIFHEFSLLISGGDLIRCLHNLENGNWDSEKVISETIMTGKGKSNPTNYSPEGFCKRMEMKKEEFLTIMEELVEKEIERIQTIFFYDSMKGHYHYAMNCGGSGDSPYTGLNDLFATNSFGVPFIKEDEHFRLVNISSVNKELDIDWDKLKKNGIDSLISKWVKGIYQTTIETWIEFENIFLSNPVKFRDEVSKKLREIAPDSLLKRLQIDFYEKRVFTKIPEECNGKMLLNSKGEPVEKTIQTLVPDIVTITYTPYDRDLLKGPLDEYTIKHDINRILYDIPKFTEKRVKGFSNSPNEAVNFFPYEKIKALGVTEMPENWKNFFKPILKIEENSQLYRIAAWVRNALKDNNFSRQVLVLHSDGNNGKSTFCNVLKQILNSLSPTFVGDCDEYGMKKGGIQEGFCLCLENHIVNIADIDDPSHLISSAFFKQITGGDTVVINQKYLKPISFNGKGMKFIMCTNSKVFMKKEANTSRIVPIHFFPLDNSERKDSSILEKGLIEQGIEFLSWCINHADYRDGGKEETVKIYSLEHPDWTLKECYEGLSDEFLYKKADEYEEEDNDTLRQAFNEEYEKTGNPKDYIRRTTFYAKMEQAVGHVIGNYSGFSPTSMDKKGREAKKKLETFLKDEGIVVKQIRESGIPVPFQAVIGVKPLQIETEADRLIWGK